MLIQTPPIPKGVANLAQGVVKTAQRGANLADKEEPFNKNQEEKETSLEEMQKIKTTKEEIRKLLKIDNQK